jgi:two-component system cell cycle response regulator DivK
VPVACGWHGRGEERRQRGGVDVEDGPDRGGQRAQHEALPRSIGSAHGYATIETRNGIEALDLARKHRPDLILMDIQLPEVSGLEVTKWIKEDDELRSIPVVAVTAFAMKGDEERIREGGCEAYLSKPISVSKFLETVRHFVKES